MRQAIVMTILGMTLLGTALGVARAGSPDRRPSPRTKYRTAAKEIRTAVNNFGSAMPGAIRRQVSRLTGTYPARRGKRESYGESWSTTGGAKTQISSIWGNHVRRTRSREGFSSSQSICAPNKNAIEISRTTLGTVDGKTHSRYLSRTLMKTFTDGALLERVGYSSKVDGREVASKMAHYYIAPDGKRTRLDGLPDRALRQMARDYFGN